MYRREGRFKPAGAGAMKFSNDVARVTLQEMQRSKLMKFSKQIHSAMMFIVAVVLSFSAIISSVGCSSDNPPAATNNEESAKAVANGPNAWQSQPPKCTATGSAEGLNGSEWICTEDFHYTCIMALHGVDNCTTISCGEKWIDKLENLVWVNSDQFTHMAMLNGPPSQCNRVKPVAGTVHTIGFEWWKNEVVGSYTVSSTDPGSATKAMISFGVSEPFTTCCFPGDSHFLILFEAVGTSQVCIPNPSTGYDLHDPNCGDGTITTTYVMQSDAGFTDCPGGGHVKIVVKEADGEGASSSYTLCRSK